MKNEDLIPDLDAARRLFEALDQIHLVSIDPDGSGRTKGKDFGEDVEAAVKWAAAENGEGRNVYWTVNKVQRGVDKKSSKSDMTAARFAHLDIDPPKDGSEWDRAAALARLQQTPQPSMIINSGNGVQAFWRLDDGVPPHEIEAINEALIAAQNGDRGTQNCDRVLRVPGFVNYPSADKRAKGRVPVLSSWIMPDSGELFTLAELGAAFARVPTVAPRRTTRISKGAGGLSPIERFNAENPIAALLAKYGYARRGNSDDYRSSEQTSGSFATRDFGDHWVSWSASDSEAGLGKAAIGGGCFGDAFDLFVHYEHGGNTDAALSAIQAIGSDVPTPSGGDMMQETVDTLPLADISSWLPGTAKPTSFLLAGLIPENEVTLLTGAGGANKSTAMQQLVTCRAAGRQFLGTDLQPGKSLYVTAEDGFDRLQWINEHICAALNVETTKLSGNMALSSLRGLTENELAVVESSGRVVATQAFARLKRTVIQTSSDLVVLDNVAHLFSGNENDRGQATSFINLLYSLGVTVVLIGHPNKSGDSYSGSTGWINSVRSQLVIERDDVDPDLRRLRIPKANYSNTDKSLDFRWHNFALWRPSELPSNVHSEIKSAARTTSENTAFLACLRERQRQGSGRQVGPNVGPSYAPTQFEGMREAKGLKRAALKRAMDRLYAIGAIESHTYRNTQKGREVTVIREVVK